MSNRTETRRPPAGSAILTWPHFAFLLGVACCPSAMAQENPGKPEKLFEAESTIAVTMTAPWRDVENKDSYDGTFPAKLEYLDESGATVTLDMTVERRGIKRRQLCDFPPIKLRFEKDEVKGTAFRGQKSLKMVTHCDKSNRFEQYYLLEMLIYRMYNRLTDFSFRVRPLQVTYVESRNGKVVDEKFAFLIEDDSDVAKRNGVKKIDVARVSHTQLEPELSALFSLFQYMIGNVDWAALAGPDPNECCHNVKLMGPEPLGPGDLAVPVPYDFDSAGLVNAHYAAPPDGLPINSVTQRLYRGYCEHNPELESARQLLIENRSAFEALIENENRLKSGSKKRAIRYLDKFYKTATDPRRFEQYVIERCRR